MANSLAAALCAPDLSPEEWTKACKSVIPSHIEVIRLEYGNVPQICGKHLPHIDLEAKLLPDAI